MDPAGTGTGGGRRTVGGVAGIWPLGQGEPDRSGASSPRTLSCPTKRQRGRARTADWTSCELCVTLGAGTVGLFGMPAPIWGCRSSDPSMVSLVYK